MVVLVLLRAASRPLRLLVCLRAACMCMSLVCTGASMDAAIACVCASVSTAQCSVLIVCVCGCERQSNWTGASAWWTRRSKWWTCPSASCGELCVTWSLCLWIRLSVCWTCMCAYAALRDGTGESCATSRSDGTSKSLSHTHLHSLTSSHAYVSLCLCSPRSGMTWSGWLYNAVSSAPQPVAKRDGSQSAEVRRSC